MRISDWSSDVCSSDLAIRLITSDPVPLPSRIGKSPAKITATVIALGRTRRSAPSRTAASTWAVSGLGPSSASACRSEEHTYELQSLMRISYAVFCLKKKNTYAVYYYFALQYPNSTIYLPHHNT